MSSTDERHGDVPISLPPISVEDGKDKYRISPLSIINHAGRKDDRELEKTVREESIEFRVYSGVEYKDDPTQKTWEKEYGVECFENGRIRKFVEYDPVNSTRESAQMTISDRIFTELENRTLRYYARNGIKEAAEILRGEEK